MDEFLAKIQSMKIGSGVDLATAEDVSLAVMNLVSLEEHFYFSGVKTGKSEYFDTGQEIRAMRKELLQELMPNHEGETWCISKHLLAASMRLIEVGTKLQSEGKKEEARVMFGRAYTVYSIFWALKLKLINAKEVQQTTDGRATLEDLVTKLADCCKE